MKQPLFFRAFLLSLGTLTGASSTLGCAAEPEPSKGEDVGHAVQASSTSALVNLTIAEGFTSSCTAGVAYATGVVDTQLNQETPNTPHPPTSQSIATGPNSSGDLRYSLLQFSMSGLPYGTNLNASAVNIYNASMALMLGPIDPSGPGTVNVHNVTSAWAQATATWNNPPTWDPSVLTTIGILSGDTAGMGVTSPPGSLSTPVNDWITSSTPNYGVLLEETGAHTNFYDSETSSPWIQPQLNAIYYLTCSDGYADCNTDGCDGCEVNLDTDPNNCGACHTACPAGDICSAGACTSP